MGFPLDRGSVEDGILTCHWHHARFDLASGCTFDLWADDVPTCQVEVRDGEVWVNAEFGHSEPAEYWRQRLEVGMEHNLGLTIAKAVQGQLVAGVAPLDILRQAALFGARNVSGWGTGMTVLTALGNLLPILPEEEAYLALFHGVRRVAADCDGAAPHRRRSALTGRAGHRPLKRWLRRWAAVRHEDAAERTILPPSLMERSQRLWLTCYWPPRPTARLQIADTPSTSSTKPSSASISLAGDMRRRCCPSLSAKWQRLGARKS